MQKKEEKRREIDLWLRFKIVHEKQSNKKWWNGKIIILDIRIKWGSVEHTDVHAEYSPYEKW